MIPWPLVRYGAIVLGVGIVLWFVYQGIYDSGYDAGRADAQGFYKPIIETAEHLAHQAEGRVKTLKEAQIAANLQLESQHAEMEQVLADRAGAAQRRINQLLRDAQAARNRCHMPEAGSSPGVPDGPAERAERHARLRDALAADFAAVGRDYESDAREILDWQRRDLSQQTLMNQP